MALITAYEEAKTKQVRRESKGNPSTGGLFNTPFFSFPDAPNLPHATLNAHDPGRVLRVHYHVRDQFQVIVDGKAKFGRHDVVPYCVHFARAYTPYGPILTDAQDGVAFLAMRAHRDAGAQRLPEKRGMLEGLAERQPWQITRRFTIAPVPADRDYLIDADPEMKDSMGLAAFSLNMKPKAYAEAPDPSQGDGQYIVVLKGSLQHEGKEYKARALVFIRPDEGRFPLKAGSAGMEAFVLNFPRPSAAASLARKEVRADSGVKAWQCSLCAFVYDEARGMPEDGIAAGTRWEDIPDDWNCPDCSAAKQDFHKIE